MDYFLLYCMRFVKAIIFTLSGGKLTCYDIDRCLSFVFWSLYCLSFGLRFLITPLSNLVGNVIQINYRKNTVLSFWYTTHLQDSCLFFTLFVFVYSGIQHILCCVFVLFVFVLCLVCLMLPVSLDCPFLTHSVFSNVYLYVNTRFV